MGFDIIFMVQHYILYPVKKNRVVIKYLNDSLWIPKIRILYLLVRINKLHSQ